jgi:hypothetical protein
MPAYSTRSTLPTGRQGLARRPGALQAIHNLVALSLVGLARGWFAEVSVGPVVSQRLLHRLPSRLADEYSA